jgi:Ca2+-binding RTX toxin-like protein
MKSANKANNTPELLEQSFNAAVLPTGWVKSSGYLKQDLFVNPAYGGDSNTIASFQEFRDNADNAYTQIAWATSGNSIAALIGYPMPIWNGPMGGKINGSAGNDLLYGALADDQFYPMSGDDSIDGGGGINTVVFSGFKDQYKISSANGETTVSGVDGVKTMKRIQYLQFTDQKVSVN